MKFRAVMQDVQYMREFQNIILTLTKLSKECVMSITPKRIIFIVNEESGSTAPLVWVEIDAKLYFDEYTLDAYINDAGEQQIMLNIGTANLGRALGAIKQNARFCKIKLNKIQFPCLTIEADVMSQSSDEARMRVHDVPVNVIPRCDYEAYSLPLHPNCKLVLTMSSNRIIKGLIEKLKNLSPSIGFYGTSNGELNLVAETEMVTITTRYKKLELRSSKEAAKAKGQQIIRASCSVDCKKTSMFLLSLQVPTTEISFGIADEHLLHMEVDIREGIALHSILPAVCV